MLENLLKIFVCRLQNKLLILDASYGKNDPCSYMDIACGLTLPHVMSMKVIWEMKNLATCQMHVSVSSCGKVKHTVTSFRNIYSSTYYCLSVHVLPPSTASPGHQAVD